MRPDLTPAAIHVVEIPPPASADASPPAAVLAWTDIDADHLREVHGNDDHAYTPRERMAGLADQRHERRVLLAAVPAGAPEPPAEPQHVLGVAYIEMPLDDNRHLADIEVLVRREARRQGIGTTLWREAERRIRAAGRTTVTGWTSHSADIPDDADTLAPATGSGALATDDAASRFASAHGFALEQVERMSALDLPVEPATIAAWRDEAQSAAGTDYRLVQWEDHTPERWLEPLAELNRRMSVDVPTGALEYHEETWDAQRVRDGDEQLAAQGRRYVLTAVEHVPSGSLVAFTMLVLPRRGDVAFQWTTLVHGDHRGRRLGLLAKAANLELLQARHPAVRRIHTGNADENAYMLAINVRMGFRVVALEGAWQRRL